jgi:hypothetical protein
MGRAGKRRVRSNADGDATREGGERAKGKMCERMTDDVTRDAVLSRS